MRMAKKSNNDPIDYKTIPEGWKEKVEERQPYICSKKHARIYKENQF
jgi:hypothetical protein